MNILKDLKRKGGLVKLDEDKIINKIIEKHSQKEEVKEFSRLTEIGLYDFEKNFIDMHLNIPKKILNLGCGAGREAIALAKRGYTTFGFDLSPNMVFESAKKF